MRLVDKLPSWLPRVLFESALIVFSVLLALILNEWRQTVARQTRAEQAVVAIHSELEENQRLVAEALAYHTRLYESFLASRERSLELPDLSVMTQGLLSPARVLQTAWAAAQTADFRTTVPYNTVLQLSTLYARQEEYAALSHAMQQVTYERVLSEGIDAMIGEYHRFIPIQQDFASRERVLLEYYREALALLRER